MIVCFCVACLCLAFYALSLRRGLISGGWEHLAFGAVALAWVVVLVGVLSGRLPLDGDGSDAGGALTKTRKETTVIDRTYRCNLCRLRHEPADLVGIAWETSVALGRDAIRRVPATQAEHHLCLGCLADAGRLAGRVAAEGEVAP